MSRLLSLPTELVRHLLEYLQGEELPLALTNTRLLTIARSIHISDDSMLSEQRLSAYMSSESLTKFVLNHGMVVVNVKLMNRTARNGYLLSVKILREQDPPCPWDEWTSMNAGYGGGCRLFHVCACMFAAQGGHLHVLQWLRSQDPPCPWNEETCSTAAYGGHLHVLQWARSQDPPCPWNMTTCGHAAIGGHLHVLQWARSQDPPCPWNEKICSAAAEGGHLHVLQWARSQDPPCPWNEQDCVYDAVLNNHQHVVRWIRSQNQ